MRSLLVSVAAVVTFPGAATAQDDVFEHFDAYNAAMDEGRFEDAVVAGFAAWRGAEAAWGDSPDTAVIAYNIASLLVRTGRAAEAVEPAARLYALAESGAAGGEVPLNDAALILGLAEFGKSGGSSGADRLREGLDGRNAPSSVDDLVARGLINLAVEAQGRRRWRDATRHAREARAVATRLGPSSWSLVVDAASFEAVAAVSDNEWTDARGAYREALRAYPESATPASDARLASLMAWEFAAAMVLKTQFERQGRTGTNFSPTDENERFEREGPVRTQASCYSLVQPRRDVDFPYSEAWKGQYGALIVTYDVNRNGALENVFVRATAPANLDAQFSNEVMDEVPFWRASVPADAADYCLKDQSVIVGFYFQ
jgi:tetratricopeptide (TPR) repeat protein